MSEPAENLAEPESFPDTEDASELLDWATERFSPNLAIVSSLGPQTIVAIDLLAKLGRSVPVILLDTGLLFAETYALKERLEERYGIHIRTVRSDVDLPAQAARYGERLWERDPDLCCHLRKVVPLRKALNGLEAWITGMRRDQCSTRASIRLVEWDAMHGLVKINPLATWSLQRTLAYLRENGIPYNPLLNQGYRSLGCSTCTRRVECGASERAGRWADSKKTECGIHFSTGADGRINLVRSTAALPATGESK